MDLFNDAHEIIPRLWLGNGRASMNYSFLSKNNIFTIFNCTKDLAFHPAVPNKFRIPIDDNLKEEEIRNMTQWSFEIVLTMMKEYYSGRNILIHCFAGMQRSAAATAMFLIATRNMTPINAVNFIQKIRPIAFTPSANFMKSINMFYSEYRSNVIPLLKSRNATAATAKFT